MRQSLKDSISKKLKKSYLKYLILIGTLTLLIIWTGCAHQKSETQPTQETLKKTNEPCWVLDETCGGEPGYLYFVGSAPIKKSSGKSRTQIIRDAKLVAKLETQSSFSRYVRNEIKSMVKQSTKCQGQEQKQCESFATTEIVSSSDIILRSGDYEQVDEFLGDDTYFYRIRIQNATARKILNMARDYLENRFSPE